MPSVFIVEDDATLRGELAALLRAGGYEPFICTDFAAAAEEALEAAPDCIVLDLKLPGADGLDICQAIRRSLRVPIIILTSADSEYEEVRGLHLGADDYVRKPYRPAALLARISSALQRSGATASTVLTVGPLSLDVATNTVTFEGSHAELTRNEARILRTLMANPGQVISRHELMVELWQSDAFIADNTLAVNVTRLRRRLASLGVPEGILSTQRGRGYCLFPEGDE